MNQKIFLIIILLLNLLLANKGNAAPAIHKTPVPAWVKPINVSGKQPNLRDIADGFYLSLADEQIHVEQQASYTHYIKNIFSEEGIQNASQISINFNPSYERLDIHQVTIWRDNQPLNQLNINAFKILANEQDLSRFIYHGSYTAYLILNDIRKGDKIEYAYTITGRNPIFENKFFLSFYLQSREPLVQRYLSIISAPSRKFSFKYNNNAPQAVVTNVNGAVKYEWDIYDIAGLQTESYMPNWLNPYQNVQVSEYTSWSEVADWAYKVNPPDTVLKGELGKRVKELKADGNIPVNQLFRSAVNMVQNEIRYMGIEMGPYSHKANNPEKVYAQRYGDCKDKSLLLVSVLRSLGFDAYMALVNTTYHRKIEDLLPTPLAFDHAIVVAYVLGQRIWIDPTMSYQGGGGTDIYCPNYEKALIVTPGNNNIASILSSSSPGKISSVEQYEITDEKKPVKLTVLTTYTGNKADYTRQYLADERKADIEKDQLNYYSRIYPRIESLDTLIINDNIELNELTLQEKYVIEDFFTHDASSNKYEASFYAYAVKELLPVVTGHRKYAVALPYPYDMEYTTEVFIPSGWSIKPQNGKIAGDGYHFEYDYAVEGRKLSLHYELSFSKDNVGSESVSQYMKDVKEITDKHLGYSYSYVPGVKNSSNTTESNVNIWIILLTLLLICSCVYIGNRIYKTETERDILAYYEPRNIGGWIILPMIGLIITVPIVIYSLIKNMYFTNAIWHVCDGTSYMTAFKSIMIFEFLYTMLQLFLSVFCLILLFKKRDIFPKWIKAFYAISLVCVLADNIFIGLYLPIVDISVRSIVQAIVAASIWIPYFSMSSRVKETFIIAYPDKGYIPLYQEETEKDSADEETAPLAISEDETETEGRVNDGVD